MFFWPVVIAGGADSVHTCESHTAPIHVTHFWPLMCGGGHSHVAFGPSHVVGSLMCGFWPLTCGGVHLHVAFGPTGLAQSTLVLEHTVILTRLGQWVQHCRWK